MILISREMSPDPIFRPVSGFLSIEIVSLNCLIISEWSICWLLLLLWSSCWPCWIFKEKCQLRFSTFVILSFITRLNEPTLKKLLFRWIQKTLSYLDNLQSYFKITALFKYRILNFRKFLTWQIIPFVLLQIQTFMFPEKFVRPQNYNE